MWAERSKPKSTKIDSKSPVLMNAGMGWGHVSGDVKMTHRRGPFS